MAIPKIPIQVRIGSNLLERLDDAVLSSEFESRNQWMIAAITHMLETDQSLPCPVTIVDVLHRKVTVMIRIEELLLELVDEQCDVYRMERALWVLNAAISYYAVTHEQIE